MGTFTTKALERLRGRQERPEDRLPLAEACYVIVDTELTGLDERRDAILSIGAVRMAAGRIPLRDTFYRLVKPGADITADSVVHHGIVPSEVRDQPEVGAALTGFLDFCGRSIVVGHCLAIDLGFIARDLKRLFGLTLGNSVLDTYSLFECLRRRLPPSHALARLRGAPSLQDLARTLGIGPARAHHALMDAFVTAQVFQQFLPLLKAAGFDRVSDLLKVGHPSRQGDMLRAAQEVCNL